jgi:hypothetical protein
VLPIILVSAHSIYVSIHSDFVASANHQNAVGNVGQRLVYALDGKCIAGCIPLTQTQATIVHVGLWSVYLLVAAVLFWRKSDAVAALVASLFLVAFGASIGAVSVYVPAYFSVLPWIAALHILPVWYLLPLVIQLAGTVTIIAGFIFPDGRFIPRWTVWLLCPVAAYVAYYLYVVVLNLPQLPFIPQPDFPTYKLAAISGLKSGLGSHAPYTTLSALRHAPDVLIVLMLVAQVYRYRRVSNPVQRQQTKWVVFGVTLAVMGSFLMSAAYYLPVGPDTFPYLLVGQCFSKTNLMQERCRAVIGNWGVRWCCIRATRSSAASSPLSGGMGSGSGASGSLSCRMAAGSTFPSPGVRRSRRLRRPSSCLHRPRMTPHRKVPLPPR